MMLVTGAGGFLGTALQQILDAQYLNYSALPGRDVIDLREIDATRYMISSAVHDDGVETVIHLAYPGTDGIDTSINTPANLTHDVLQIDMNVIRACALAKVQKLICIGSVCSYPEEVTFPTGEDQLFSGPPEAVNAPYGHAKRMQLALLEAYRRQEGLHYTQLILSNLYGPGDRSGHVIPSTIRKVLLAKAEGAKAITMWGDGTASREFLYVTDAAEAVLAAVQRRAENGPLNICSGTEILIRHLVHRVSAQLEYWGAIQWDHSKPSGQPRRQFSYARAHTHLGWFPQTSFEEGLAKTVDAMKGLL